MYDEIPATNQKITVIQLVKLKYKHSDKGINYIVSGAQNGSICFINYISNNPEYFLESDKPHDSLVKQIIVLYNNYFKDYIVLYLIEKQGTIIVKNLMNKIIKIYNIDRDISNVERLSNNFFIYTEAESNKLHIVDSEDIINNLTTIQKVELMYDPYLVKYLQDGETIFSFGYEFSDGNPLQGKAIDYVYLKSNGGKNIDFNEDMKEDNSDNEEENDNCSEKSL